jgi:hypothetical protein
MPGTRSRDCSGDIIRNKQGRHGWSIITETLNLLVAFTKESVAYKRICIQMRW